MRPRPFRTILDADVQPQFSAGGPVLAVYAEICCQASNLWTEERMSMGLVFLAPLVPGNLGVDSVVLFVIYWRKRERLRIGA